MNRQYQIQTTALPDKVSSLAISASGRTLAVLGSGYIQARDLVTGTVTERQDLLGSTYIPPLWRSRFASNSESTVLCADGNLLTAGAARVELASGQLAWHRTGLYPEPKPNGRNFCGWAARAMDVSPAGDVMAVSHGDKSIALLDTATGSDRCHLIGHKKYPGACLFLDNGAVLASGGQDKTLRFWDVQAGRQIGASDAGIVATRMAKALNDQLLVVASSFSGKLQVFDRAGRVAVTLKGHKGGVRGVATLSDDQHVVTVGGTDNCLRFWDVSDGRMVQEISYASTLTKTLQPGHALAVNPANDDIYLALEFDPRLIRFF